MVAAAAGVDEIEEEDTGPAEANYDYLLSMPIQSLTLEKVSYFPFAQFMLLSIFLCLPASCYGLSCSLLSEGT